MPFRQKKPPTGRPGNSSCEVSSSSRYLSNTTKYHCLANPSLSRPYGSRHTSCNCTRFYKPQKLAKLRRCSRDRWSDFRRDRCGTFADRQHWRAQSQPQLSSQPRPRLSWPSPSRSLQPSGALYHSFYPQNHSISKFEVGRADVYAYKVVPAVQARMPIASGSPTRRAASPRPRSSPARR